ncbi:MAG: TonB-dependent receptor, partial [Hyphomonadaceae bacterium]
MKSSVASKSVFSLLLGASAFALFAPQGAYAQEAQVTNSDDVIVTARRRSEALQDVPAQVTAFNAQAIEDRGIERPADFIAAVPSVTFVETQNAGTSFLVIRGISQARNSEPSAAIVVDGVPMTQPAQFNQELVDIQQIEVLKGPQGALYGRNAIGGAVVITTRAPTDHFEGSATIGYESGPGGRFRGVLSGPVTDGLRFRAALSYFDTDGHLTNIDTTSPSARSEADPVQDLNARLSFLLDPTPNFSIDLRFAYDNLETRALYYAIDNFGSPGFNNPNTILPINLNNSGMNERDIYDVALRMNWSQPYGDWTSITGFNRVEEILTGDGYTFDPYGASKIFFDFGQSQFLEVDTITQEFRFTSPETNRFRWAVGAQFFWTDRFISTGNMCDGPTDVGVIPLYHSPYPVDCDMSFEPHAQISWLADSQDQFAYAAYLQTSTDITDNLELSVNVRYDHDTRENTTETTQFYLDKAGIPGTEGEVREESWDDWQPQVILRYAVSDDVNIYGSYSRGFRSGGFNQTGVSTAAAANGLYGVGDLFDQETADTFELGFKSTLFDRRLRLNGSVYHTTSEGAYYFIFIASNSTQNLGNIDEVEYRGFDIEWSAQISDHFSIDGGFGMIDSEITAFADPLAIGADAPLVSDYTLNLGAQLDFPISDGLNGMVRLDLNRIGDTV